MITITTCLDCGHTQLTEFDGRKYIAVHIFCDECGKSYIRSLVDPVGNQTAGLRGVAAVRGSTCRPKLPMTGSSSWAQLTDTKAGFRLCYI